MKDNTIVKVAAIGFVALVVVPTAINLIGSGVCGIANSVSKAKFNRKIKKGLKDGSIVEIDGEYYEVAVEEA